MRAEELLVYHGFDCKIWESPISNNLGGCYGSSPWKLNDGWMHSSTQDECKSILRSSVFQPRLQLKILQTIDFDKKVGFSRFYFSPGGRNVFAGPILFQLDKINYFQRTFQNKIVALKLTISDQKYWCFFHGNGISTPGGNVACLRDPNLKVASPWATRLLNTPTKPVLVFSRCAPRSFRARVPDQRSPSSSWWSSTSCRSPPSPSSTPRSCSS